MNILVTGSNGFIGKALIQELDRLEHHVYGLDNKNDGKDSQATPLKQFYLQDLTQPFHIDIPFDHVFHLGALNVTHVAKASYQEYHKVNVQGTENLIKAVNTKNFVFMSTIKVYQDQGGTIDEESPLGPQSDYERSKLEAEEICRKHFNELNLTIFRSVNVVGPGQAEKAVIPVFFKKAINGEPLELIYSTQTPLQMIFIDDLIQAFCLLLQKDQGVGIMNLCPEETIALGELAHEVVTICHSKSLVQSIGDDEVIFNKYVSNKARSILGWQSRASVKDILKNYYKYISVLK